MSGSFWLWKGCRSPKLSEGQAWKDQEAAHFEPVFLVFFGMKGPWVRGCPLIQQTAPTRKAKRPACRKQEQNSLVRLNHESVFNVAPRIKHHQTLFFVKPGSCSVMFSWCYPEFCHVLSINPNSKRVITMSPWRFAVLAVLAACIAFVEGKPHQMPKMPGGALASDVGKRHWHVPEI